MVLVLILISHFLEYEGKKKIPRGGSLEMCVCVWISSQEPGGTGWVSAGLAEPESSQCDQLC